MYEIFRQAGKIVPRLPRWLRQIAAIAIGTVAWGMARRARKHVTANVAQVLGRSVRPSFADRVRAQLVVRRVFCHCIDNYLELFALPYLTREEVLVRLDMKGVENLEEALSHGRGVVVVSAHLGPFEYTSSWFSGQGYKVVIPVENVGDKRMLQLMLELRRRNGVDFVPLDGVKATRAIFNALQRNEIVLITADRAVEGESVVMDFFGAPARLPSGPVDLALRTGAPLVGGFGWRTSRGRVTCEFTRLSLALPPDQQHKPDVLQAALTRQLEGIVSAHLDQWVVFEPMWSGVDVRG